MMKPVHSRRSAVALLFCTVLISACSGSGSDPDSEPSATQVPVVSGVPLETEAPVEFVAPPESGLSTELDVVNSDTGGDVVGNSGNDMALENDDGVEESAITDTTAVDSVDVDEIDESDPAPESADQPSNETGLDSVTTEIAETSEQAEPTPAIVDTGTQVIGFGSMPGGLLPFVETRVPLQQERYQSLAPEVQASLAPDCLLTGSSPIICYRSEDRSLSGVNFDGTPRWSFVLPGDNATNRIEGLELIGFANFAIIANITVNPAEPRQEVSIFGVNGGFLNTYPLFENLRDFDGQAGTSKMAVNIQGEPLLSLGVFNNFSFGIDSTRLVVAGNYYNLIDGGDPAQLNDWRHTGVIIETLNTSTAQRLSAQMIPGALISNAAEESLTRSITGASDNTVRLVLNDRIFEMDMLVLDSLPPSFTVGSELLAATMHQRIPTMIEAVSRDYSFISRGLLNLAPEPALLPGESNCEFPTDAPLGQAVQCTVSTDSVSTACSVSGEITDRITSERNFAPGTGSWIVWTRTLDFDQCVSGSDSVNPAYRPFADGTLVIRDYEGAIRRGFLDEELVTYVDVTRASTPIVPGDDTRIEDRINGSFRTADLATDFGGPSREIESNIESYVRNLIPIPSRGQFEFNELTPASTTSVSNQQFQSTEMLSEITPSLELSGSVRIDYDENLSLVHELSLTQAPWVANGFVLSTSVVDSNGVSLDVSTNEFPDQRDPTTVLQAVFQSTPDQTVTYTFPLEGLEIPWGNIPAL